MKNIFARQQKYKIEKLICEDQLISLEEYNKIYENKFIGKEFQCKDKIKSDNTTASKKRNVDLMFHIVENNPILHTHYCMSQRKIVIPLKSHSTEIKHLLKLYENMHSNYKQNIHNIQNIIHDIVNQDSKKNYVLRNLSNNDLTQIIQLTKKELIIFYTQSIIDYQVLLDYAQTLEHIALSK